MVSKSLNEALKSCLTDHHKISFYEAKVIRELILADGVMSDEERNMLNTALKEDQFDEKAHKLLEQLLLRNR